VIEKLTTWVVRSALAELKSFPRGQDDLRVAVNVSARTIGRPSFAAEVIAILEELELPGTRLKIEVTETALMADPERAALVLTRLADAGVGISLDDFGRGQTSLGYLSALPLDELKIDRGFVTGMLDNPTHAAIVRSILELGHNLGLRVVAEGVETEAVLEHLIDIGCDVVQGFLLGRPMPSAALAARMWDAQPSVTPGV
jgi:EAL domain-containing protein (putative c-di-GMP-specific phosphodiesterase class I)